MSLSKNLQAVKLRAIAKGLGATLSNEDNQFFFLMKWDKFLTASFHFGSWQQEGRIVIRAHHPYRHSSRTEITVSASRSVALIVRDVERRFVPEAREFWRKCEKDSRATEAKHLNEKLRIESFLDEFGADYEDAKRQGSCHHSGQFSARGVSFTSYDLSESRKSCRVTIDCSEPCLRHLLRLVRADYDFRQSLVGSQNPTS